MKKVLTILTAVLLIGSLVACSDQTIPSGSNAGDAKEVKTAEQSEELAEEVEAEVEAEKAEKALEAKLDNQDIEKAVSAMSSSDNGETSSYMELAEEQILADWDFLLVAYDGNDGEQKIMTTSDFTSAGSEAPSFKAYSDHTYKLHLLTDTKINGEWSALSDSMVDQVDNLAYAYNLPNDNNVNISGLILKEDVDEKGKASRLTISINDDNGETAILVMFTR